MKFWFVYCCFFFLNIQSIWSSLKSIMEWFKHFCLQTDKTLWSYYSNKTFSPEDRGETRLYFAGENNKPDFVTVRPSTSNQLSTQYYRRNGTNLFLSNAIKLTLISKFVTLTMEVQTRKHLSEKLLYWKKGERVRTNMDPFSQYFCVALLDSQGF